MSDEPEVLQRPLPTTTMRSTIIAGVVVFVFGVIILFFGFPLSFYVERPYGKGSCSRVLYPNTLGATHVGIETSAAGISQ